ncbi:MAG: 3'-5' exonuclease, partial [Nitrospinota bacterium]|nr:3'-5' exonuclease [Nitrospinota bacterium]
MSNVRVSNPRLKGRDVLQEKFVVVDLETTGLSPRNNAIIEIGAVKFEAGAAKYATMEALIDPEMDIPGVITGINGISNE